MKLRKLLPVIHADNYVLDFYDGNPDGRTRGGVTLSHDDALYVFGDYRVHLVHYVDCGEHAEITLHKK